jgi:hypothetical protein
VNRSDLWIVAGLLAIAAGLMFLPVPPDNREGLFMIVGGLLAILKGNGAAPKP